ncbi:MAG: transposase, partial [Thaumarchaeota archaeon]|nr:transposase [Nitrososphaerota archaeon]
MLRYSALAKRPSQFKSFTGLDVAEFDSLYSTIESRYEEFEQKRLSSRSDRKRGIGAGRPFAHPLKDRFLMLLVYYRLYITSILVGYLFDLDQTNVLRDIRRLEPLAKECLPLPKKIYEGTRRARTLEEVEEYFPGFIAIVDSFEQEIPRPQNKRRRKSYYSGKRKKHTVKTQLAVNKEGLIFHRTDHVRGRRHDYDLFKEKHPKLP